MHAWEAIQNTVDYIEEHLQEEIHIEDLAQIASLSPFYYQRLFKRLVKKTVNEYIKLRRLARAIEELDTEQNRILDIAVKYGFSSHANFTRAFKETYGITPESYKKTHPLLNTFIKPQIAMHYTLIDEGVPLIAGSIILEIQKKTLTQPEYYIGIASKVEIAGQIPAGESTGIDKPGQTWDLFHARKAEIASLIDPETELGISYQEETDKDMFTYFAGAPARTDPGGTPGEFTRWELPAGEYIICKIEAGTFKELVTEALYQAINYTYTTWLPRHNLAVSPFSAEKYYFNTEDNISYMELWSQIRNPDD